MGGQFFEDAKRNNGFNVDPGPDNLVVIGIDTKHTSRAEHRFFDKRVLLPISPLDVANIDELGVTQDVLYRKMKVEGFKGLVAVVVEGRQRVRWARAVNKKRLAKGLPTITVPVREMTGTELQVWRRSRAANVVRVVSSPIALAEEMEEMLGEGDTVEDIATTYAYTVDVVKTHLDLRKQAPSLQKLVSEKRMSITSAKLMFSMSYDEQETKCAELVAAGEKITVERTRAAMSSGAAEKLPGLKLKQIHKLYNASEGVLEEHDRKVIGALLGKGGERQVKGMTKLLRELGYALAD